MMRSASPRGRWYAAGITDKNDPAIAASGEFKQAGTGYQGRPVRLHQEQLPRASDCRARPDCHATAGLSWPPDHPCGACRRRERPGAQNTGSKPHGEAHAPALPRLCFARTGEAVKAGETVGTGEDVRQCFALIVTEADGRFVMVMNGATASTPALTERIK